MSFDLTIWKQGDLAGKTDAEAVIAAIRNDTAHPAMQRFDAKAFVDDVRAEFDAKENFSADDEDEEDDDDDGLPFVLDVADFTGSAANWISVSMGFNKAAAVLPRLVKVAAEHGLVVFDDQTGELHRGG